MAPRTRSLASEAASASRVYVDFDDVLCETARGLIDLLQAEFGRSARYEEMHWFELDRSFGLTAEELERFFVSVHHPETLEGLAPTPGAREVLAAWRDQGCEVYIVTGRPPETAEPSHAWLETHAIPYDRLVFVDKYRRLAPGPDLVTLDELAGMEFVLAIDDAPAMIRFLSEATPVPVVIFNRPWNRRLPSSNGRPAHRCHSWAEIASRGESLLGAPAGRSRLSGISPM